MDSGFSCFYFRYLVYFALYMDYVLNELWRTVLDYWMLRSTWCPLREYHVW